jgi:phage regulator Rha-like protein
MLQLTGTEMKNLRFQFETSSSGYGGRRYSPYAFTENGVAMLSSVLNSERAINVNIQIMRTFTKLRELLGTHRDLQRKIDELEKKHDRKFAVVFRAIKLLIKHPVKHVDGDWYRT